METKNLLKSLKRRLGLVTAILAMLMVSQGAWALASFTESDIYYQKGTGSDTRLNAGGTKTADLGTVTTTIKITQYHGWLKQCNTDDDDLCGTGYASYNLKNIDKDTWKYATWQTIAQQGWNWNNWDGCRYPDFYKTGGTLELTDLAGGPGSYEFHAQVRTKSKKGCTQEIYSPSGADYIISFVVPGFTDVSPSTLNFADTKVGSETESQSVTFKMYGSTIKLTTSTPTNFTVSTSKPSSSGKSGSVTVTFKPKSTGDKSETLTLTDNYGKTTSITLKGKGTPACTPPTIDSTTPNSRCGTGTVTIRATASAGTVKWYAASTGGSSLVEGYSFTTPQIASTTIYYAEADDNGCVSASRTPVTATVITRPAAPTSGGDISVCYGSDAEFKATQANNRCIDWYTASTGGTKLETCQNTYTKTNLISDYTVYAEARIADNGCISASRTAIKATVNALPTASISGGNEVCQNGSLTLTGSGGTQYSWNNGAYSSTATYNVPTSTSGQKEITLKVKDSNNCESASADQKNVTVKTQPTAGTITSGDPVCKGSTVTLEVTNPSSASVQWQNSSKEDISGATNTSYITPELQTSTDYYVKFTKDGCSSTSAKGTATVKTASLSLTATPAVVNPYTPVTLTAKNQSDTETNSDWTIAGAGSYFTESDNPTGVSTVVMKPAKDVKTTVTATATVDGCPVSDIYSVTPTPDTEVCN